MSRTMRAGLVLLAAILTVAAALAASEFRRAELERTARSRALLYQAGLTAALDRFAHLPFVLARDREVQDGALGLGLGELNTRLERIADQARLDAIYLMDRTGLTIAASNHDDPVTFLGKSYAFRPYFQEALSGSPGSFFAIGATTRRPGYFLSEAVRRADGSISGVIAIKVDLQGLATTWGDAGETVIVTNRDGIVVLASEPAALFRTTRPISDTRLTAIRQERQFVGAALDPLDWSETASGIRYSGQNHVAVAEPIAVTGWTLHYLRPVAPIWQTGMIAGAAMLATILLALGTLTLVRQRRVRAALSASEAERSLLQVANAALEREIEDRRRAEAELDKAQEALRRSTKLAALGQVSASVAHELGQPIAALKTHLTTAEMTGQTSPLFGRIGRLVERMETLTRDLRFFARTGAPEPETFDLRQVLDGASDLLLPAQKASANARFSTTLPAVPVPVTANRQRIEQVVVNLVRNALQSVQATGQPGEVTLTITEAAEIIVADTGEGLGGRDINDLQEPFHSSRDSGEGMGLGLAICAAIVQDHGGTLTANERPDGNGAVFIVSLPPAEVGSGMAGAA